MFILVFIYKEDQPPNQRIKLILINICESGANVKGK